MREAKALFPNLYGGKDSFYSANSRHKIKQRLVKETGIDFRIKDFRSTLTSLTVNEDISRLPAMSVQLRHASMATTQKYYTAIGRSSAGKKLKNIWKQSRVMVPKHPLIEIGTEVSKSD